MKLVEQRLLRGPNRYARQPCIMALVELEPEDARPLPPAAVDLLSQLPHARALADGATPAHLVAALAQSLQRAAGCGGAFQTVQAEHGHPGRYRLALGYRVEEVAECALQQALAIARDLSRGEPPAWAQALAGLRRLAQEYLAGPGAIPFLKAALRRRIPVQGPAAPGQAYLLGWGCRQRRVEPADVERYAPAELLNSLFSAGDDGRMPLIAVTGTNGKTTVTRMIAHAYTLAGMRTGMASSEGVDIAGERVDHGDCTGYWSARLVLESPRTEAAVLETARGGLLKRGLGFDRCDVAVMLNVSADHLGLDGVQDVAGMAAVKAVVARTARRAAVLNAQDACCVGMRGLLARGVEAIYFSLDADEPVLKRHLDQGGRGLYLQDRTIMLGHGSRRSGLLDIAAMPAALGGHAMHNVANAMAAAAALIGAGCTPALAVAALSSFRSDARDNPLRANLFQAAGITILVDYAHNSVACASLAKMARSMSSGMLRAVITVPGDRRDADLFEIGRVCGAGFDELAVYEAEPRGRERGDTARRLLAGAAAAGTRWLRAEPEAVRALSLMLERCRAGDLLVYTCGGALDDLVAALRPLDAAGADRIERRSLAPF